MTPPDPVLEALRREVRRRLPKLLLRAEREEDVVEELAQLLADAASERPTESALDPDAGDLAHRCSRWVDAQIPDFAALSLSIAHYSGPAARPLESNPMSSPRTPSKHSVTVRAAELCFALLRDLRFGLRMLAKRPFFTAIAVVTIGLGVGVNASVFSVVDALLMRPVPAANSDQLVNFYTVDETDSMYYSTTSLFDIEYFAERSETLEDLQAYSLTVLAFDHGAPRIAIGAQVTEGWFAMLGIDAAVGRLLEAGDADAELAVLGHETWRREFGGDPQVVGSMVRLQGRPFTIVGVVPAGFRGFFQGLTPEVWIPIRTGQRIGGGTMQSAGRRTEGLDTISDPAYRFSWGMGRLQPGSSLPQVVAEFDTLAAAAGVSFPDTHEKRRFAFLPTRDVRLVPEVDGPLRLAGLLALAVASLVLLIACANLANMLLARAVGRRKEIATRLSLGAGRLQILRQLLAESLVLAAAGGAVGLAIAVVSGRWLANPDLPFPVPLDFGVALDARVILFVVGLTLATCVGFGMWPALASMRLDLSTTMREEGRGGGGRRKGGLRSALVIAQVALSFVLLCSAGLMLRSLDASRSADPGFDTDNVVVAAFSPDMQGLDDERVEEFFQRLRQRLEALPGAQAVAEVGRIPLGFESNSTPVAPLEKRSQPLDEWARTDIDSSSPGYFKLMGIPLRAGRAFAESDREDTAYVVVINETAARMLWADLPAGEWPLGRQLILDNGGREDEVTVVGIVADGKYRSLTEDPRAFVWQPMAQQPRGLRRVLVAHQGSPAPIMDCIRRTARQLDERVGPIEVTTLEDSFDSALFVARTGSNLLGLTALLGLLLAAVGLYGLLAQAVGERRHEMGVRMALGASRWTVLRMILRDGLLLVGIGAGVGLAGALAAGRALSSFLYGVGAADPITFLGVFLVPAVVALVACWLPASRASKVDLSTALRCD